MSYGQLPKLTILSGATKSNILPCRGVFDDAYLFGIMGKSVTDALAFTIEVTDAPDPVTTSDWYTLADSANVPATLPTVNKARTYQSPMSFSAIRISAPSAVSVDHVWRLSKFVQTHHGGLG